jgi:hypothetical protein
MPTQIFEGDATGHLTEVTDKAGPPWRVPRVGRGLALADLDNDGRTDVLVLSQDAPLAYLHNRSRGGHFLVVGLEGRASNRDAIGARVVIEAGGRRQVLEKFGGGSYQSTSDPRLHIGLGHATKVELLEVRWPSGRVDRHRDLAVDSAYRLCEGETKPKPLPGW